MCVTVWAGVVVIAWVRKGVCGWDNLDKYVCGGRGGGGVCE